MPMTPVSEKPLRPVFSKRNLPCFVLLVSVYVKTSF